MNLHASKISISHVSCIDLILTNKRRSFINTTVIETGLSDHHKMTVSILRSHFKKAKPKTVTYRCCDTICHKRHYMSQHATL